MFSVEVSSRDTAGAQTSFLCLLQGFSVRVPCAAALLENLCGINCRKLLKLKNSISLTEQPVRLRPCPSYSCKRLDLIECSRQNLTEPSTLLQIHIELRRGVAQGTCACNLPEENQNNTSNLRYYPSAYAHNQVLSATTYQGHETTAGTWIPIATILTLLVVFTNVSDDKNSCKATAKQNTSNHHDDDDDDEDEDKDNDDENENEEEEDDDEDDGTGIDVYSPQ